MSAKYLAAAIELDHSGQTCGHCGGVNTWCDDIGFFYADNSQGQYVAGCEECVGHPGGDR